jgi:predicted aspartyl protease
MSVVYTEITLKNANYLAIAATGLLKDHKIRQITVNAMVDTGAWTLVINKETSGLLGLQILHTKTKTVCSQTVQ